jgi:hypothetical protein
LLAVAAHSTACLQSINTLSRPIASEGFHEWRKKASAVLNVDGLSRANGIARKTCHFQAFDELPVDGASGSLKARAIPRLLGLSLSLSLSQWTKEIKWLSELLKTDHKK